MDESRKVTSPLLCQEAVSLMIYGTIGIIIILFLPYWIRQQMDLYYLKSVARQARERYMQQVTEEYRQWELQAQREMFKSQQTESHSEREEERQQEFDEEDTRDPPTAHGLAHELSHGDQ
ncbi:uncharacterized protein LOC131943572 [Physella acuta]|uniref:uncharacterized protein LOC131943572 n=1 Tax=Physella acuta TaxID=109671 RepID=UPI0027DDE89D|nr:uncharacterized protein LOC131943572 [Physella acuta]